ncbi:MAG: hypothetical protein IPK60_07665 [Sandaracinaceae bacterium]|nr:hypothetical protein [Sandaracinaceae bacterium]
MKPETIGYARWIGSALAAVLVMSVVSVFAPHVRVAPFVVYSTAFCCVVAATLFTAWAAPPLARSSLILVLVAIAALEIVATLKPGTTSLWAASVVLSALLFAGTAIGTVIGRAIQHPGQLFIVGVVFTLADTFSVFHPAGPSAAIVYAAPSLMSVLALPWPLFGTEEFVPVLGVGDVTAAALFISASRVHELPLSRTIIALFVGLMGTMAFVWWTELAMPALPLMSFAVIAAHPRARRLRREDRRPALIGFAVMATLYVLAWLALSRGTTP